MSEIKQILHNFLENKENITNEANTKQFIIIPIIKNILGFDVYSPSEFLSEVVADVAGKKGERLDYALKVNGRISIIIECKHHTSQLDESCKAQLERYFQCRHDVQDAKIAILTNGLVWKFFSDSTKPNVLDAEPFYVFDIQNESTHSRLENFKKDRFDVENILKWIRVRNKVRDMRRLFDAIFNYNKETPSTELKKVLEFAVAMNIDIGGRLTESKVQEYHYPFMQAREEFTEELIEKVVQKGLSAGKEESIEGDEDEITEYEIEVCKAVQIMCADIVGDLDMIQIKNRAGVGRSLICLDGKQTKPILAMSFDKEKSHIIIGRGERMQVPKGDIAQICKFKNAIREAVQQYLQ